MSIEMDKRKWIFGITSILTILILLTNSGIRYNIGVLILFLSIGLFSLYGMFLSVDNLAISLNKIFCIFYYFFFSIAPAIQYKNGIIFWIGNFTIPDSTYLKAGVILIIILILYIFIYNKSFNFFNSKKIKGNEISKITYKLKAKKLKYLYIISSISVLLYIYLLKFNFNLLLFRPYSFNLKENTNLGLVGYALLLIVRYLPFYILIYYKLIVPKNNRNTLFLFAFFLLVFFPTSLSRGVLAIVYITLIIVFMPVFKKGMNFILLFMSGFLIVFPLFDSFRYLNEGKFKLSYDFFNSAHFDAFQNFAFLINEGLITNGKQLIGSIFFFIQESHWESRPPGSGHLLGEKLEYGYLNVAMPYFGEGYINFGTVGILVFLLMIVIFNSFFDYRSVRFYRKNIERVFYCIVIGWEFYLLRGDLMSSIKIIVSLLIGLLFIQFLISKMIIKSIDL